ncbi:MAG: T9SS type A sorting domain-containing protein [candidate division Zixibacteria bacterium]|nr:T9SS type A sorting domain-containing protein [candidate division Zixibacteria bacterium]
MDCYGGWGLLISDTDLDYCTFDDYDVSGQISSITFWGCDLDNNGGWHECNEQPMTFNIVFYPDNGAGAPDEGNPSATYLVTGEHDPSMVCELSGQFQAWRWEIILNPFCTQLNGWISIQGVGDNNNCVFLWLNSDQAYGYNSWYDGGYSEYQQAFCLDGWISPECLICETVNYTPLVPQNGGLIIWDLTITNCGYNPVEPVVGELVPTNIDCNGPQYDFDIISNITSALNPGQSITQHYYYNPGVVAPFFTNVAIWIYIGSALNNYLGNCCFELIFTSEWGRGGDASSWGENGEWGELEDGILPNTSALGQNYPNPFNATTAIPFDVAETSYVNISVYNIAGQLVDVLHDGEMSAGNHTVTWNASTVSSGVYFYKLIVNDYTTTKRMELLK